jgi:ribosome-binding factor A
MAVSRMRRVNEVLREVIGDELTSLSDPRLNMVTITAVDTSPDLRSARVYFTVLGGEDARDAALEALAKAHGVIQRAIGAETRMKRTPTLRFEYDEAVERGLRISAILDDPEDGQR